MKIIGISPLDRNATVCLVENGQILSAVSEERFSRKKMHAGFPYQALQYLFDQHGLTPEQIDNVTYAFFDAATEAGMMRSSYLDYAERMRQVDCREITSRFKHLPPAPDIDFQVPGLSRSQLQMKKPWYHHVFYTLAATATPIAKYIQAREYKKWLTGAAADHRDFETQLLQGLDQFGLTAKLHRCDHHLTHSANAYYTSGFDNALIVTLDGYGSGLAGSIAIGQAGKIERIHALPYPASLGEFYERVTSSLGFRPGRHEGKIVGLAAYEPTGLLGDWVKTFFEDSPGDICYKWPHNIYFSRYLASKFAKPVVSAAYQKTLEEIASAYVAHYQKKTGLRHLCLSGGVAANVKLNQRLFEIPGIDHIYVHPAMGDAGCSVGAALLLTAEKQGLQPSKLNDVFLGPQYSESDMYTALSEAGFTPQTPQQIEARVAELLDQGQIVARFSGRVEYGPRALGNRSILYHAKDPSVNLWLNQQLQRTEFMPFAPATLYDHRQMCYRGVQGAEYTAQYMTITFDCTDFMRTNCPAAVHVDGTARPQLVSEQHNPGFYRIIDAYYRRTGIPSIINTSFNMHEEPIVCTPQDAVRAFKLGHLPYMTMGPFLVTAE